VRGIATGIICFKSIVEETNDNLDEMNASQECVDLWATYQTRYGRSMAVCAKYGYVEIEWNHKLIGSHHPDGVILSVYDSNK
jgi:hypothetical protein